jgi:DNA-binding MarR family transcriptional regulator
MRSQNLKIARRAAACAAQRGSGVRRRSGQTAAAGAGRRRQLERSALFAARTLVDRMRSLYRELERRTGAPIALHRALNCIAGNPGITASGLAATLGTQRPAVSHMLRALTERGWIERRRQASDQRSVNLYVTGQGQQVLGATAGRAVGTLQRCVRTLSVPRLRGLAAGLEALLVTLPPPPERATALRSAR